MQTLIDGAVIVQVALEAEGVAKSKPGVIPAVVVDPFLANDPFNPLTPESDHDAFNDTWIDRAGDPYPVKNQTYLAEPTTIGFGGPIGGYAVTPRDTFIPGQN